VRLKRSFYGFGSGAIVDWRSNISDRDAMIAEIRRVVQPFLRSDGFAGSFPHYRKKTPTGIDLLTIQFDRHGGGFVIEIARCPVEGVLTAWGAAVSPEKVRAWDVHPNYRKRIQPRVGGGTDAWFRFDDAPVSHAAAAALKCLSNSDLWNDVQMCGSNRPYAS
jgi:hypothetical protein